MELLLKSRYHVQAFILFAFVIVFVLLGTRELWTHEARWGLICQEMLKTGDYLHPYLHGEPYYDKPLPSYWIMIATAKIFGVLNEWTLRIPGAILGFFSILALYGLGKKLFNKETGLLAGCILATTPLYISWARIASADIMNAAGIIFALYWYFLKREDNGLYSYTVFFILMALTSLTKGLTGVVIPCLFIFPDLILQGQWKKHINLKIGIAAIPALLLYISPFFLSQLFSDTSYNENGLVQVFRENVQRFFNPFDHKGTPLTYFQYLPLYFFPWIIPFLPAVYLTIKTWKTQNLNSRWTALAFGLVFLFLSISGSRRSYYLLPLVPIAALWVADYCLNYAGVKFRNNCFILLLITGSLSLLFTVIVQPLKEKLGGVRPFIHSVQTEIKNAQEYHYVIFRALPKTGFYLESKTSITWLRDNRDIKKLPGLFSDGKTIILTSKKHEPEVDLLLKSLSFSKKKQEISISWLKKYLKENKDSVIAYIPELKS